MLSTVLSYLDPIQVQCISGTREGIPGTAPNSEKSIEETNQTIMALVLASLMTLAKPVTTQNSPAFMKRWQAALASHNIADMIPTASWTGLVALATSFQRIIASRNDFRAEIVDRLLHFTKTGAEGAVLSQIKLV